MCVSDEAASKGKEENEEIDRSLLKSVFLHRTVVPAVYNMGAKVLPAVQVLREITKTRAESGGGERRNP